MDITFFYVSAAVVVLFFIISLKIKKPGFASIIIGLIYIGYTMLFEITFSEILKLYYYINPEVSLTYLVLAVVFIYVPLIIIYTNFLPSKLSYALIYTAVWISLMLIFEQASLLTKTIVFTGWIYFPWSLIAYIISFGWVYPAYRYIQTKTI